MKKARYRFFISYRHDGGLDAKEQIEKELTKKRHRVLADTQIDSGAPLDDGVRKKIAQSHFCLAIIVGDPESQGAWVHQEIGFAHACNVCVVPVAINSASERLGMISNMKPILAESSLQAAELVGKEDWEGNYLCAPQEGRAVFDYQQEARLRTELLERVARDIRLDVARRVARKDRPIIVRQRSSLTSFSLPKSDKDNNWTNVKNWREYEWANPEERNELERVGTGRFDLMIDLTRRPGHERKIQLAKLKSLHDFLIEKGDKVRVVVRECLPSEGLTVIGDYWLLQSPTVGPTEKTRYTFSTWHAPTVDKYGKNFDQEFESLWDPNKPNKGMERINDAIKEIESDLAMAVPSS